MRAQAAVGDVNKILTKNIQNLVENNAKIEVLLDKTVAMKEKSGLLRK